MEYTSKELLLEINTVVADSELEDIAETIERMRHRCITKLQIMFFEKRDRHLVELSDELTAVLPSLSRGEGKKYAHQLEAEVIEMVEDDFRVLERAKENARFLAYQLMRSALQYEASKGDTTPTPQSDGSGSPVSEKEYTGLSFDRDRSSLRS